MSYKVGSKYVHLERHFNINKIKAELNKQTAELKKEVAMEIITRLVTKSPVRTGRFRASWVVGADAPNREKPTFNGDDGGQGSLNRVIQGVSEIEENSDIIISNNLDYAVALEFGHSKQAPLGIVDPTLSEVEAKYKGGGK